MKQSLTLNPNLDFSAGDPRCKFPKVNGINATRLPGLPRAVRALREPKDRASSGGHETKVTE